MMEFKVVKFRKKHIPTLKDICRRVGKFPYPDISDSSCIVRCSVSDINGNIIGGAFIRTFTEAVIYVEPELQSYTRARVVNELVRIGKIACKNKGFNMLHVFLYDMKSFGNYLRKKLNFIKSKAECYELKV